MKNPPDTIPPWLQRLPRPVFGPFGPGVAIGAIRSRWLAKGNSGDFAMRETVEVIHFWYGGQRSSRVQMKDVLVMQ